MTKIGLPVPFGFTVTTEACNRYYDEGQVIADDIRTSIFEKLEELENVTGKKFGSVENPLLVSVRSGAKISMPGMMDTILNLGLNDDTVEGLAALTENPRFAYDSYRRFIQMFGDVVMEIDKRKFDAIFDGAKEAKGCESDVDLTADDLKDIIVKYKELVKQEMGRDFPQVPKDQLMEAVMAVFRSWNNDRAILYRKLNEIPDSINTRSSVVHGIRKHGKHFRYRRGIYEKRSYRRKGSLRRIPGKRPGRGRCSRYKDAAAYIRNG